MSTRTRAGVTINHEEGALENSIMLLNKNGQPDYGMKGRRWVKDGPMEFEDRQAEALYYAKTIRERAATYRSRAHKQKEEQDASE